METLDRDLDRHLDIHLHPTEMSRLVTLDCSHELAFEWLAHLVSCRLCRHRLAQGFPSESRRILDRFLLLHDSDEPVVRIHLRAYDEVFDRVRARGLAELSTDTRVAEVRSEALHRSRHRSHGSGYSITSST